MTRRDVKIVFFATWFGPLHDDSETIGYESYSDHVQFCRANEYEYRFLYFSGADWYTNILKQDYFPMHGALSMYNEGFIAK